MEDPQLSYLGLRPPKLIERLESLSPLVNETFFQAQYKTAEYSVSPKNLKAILKEALVAKSIKMVFGRRVESVSRNKPGDDILGKMHVVTDVSNHDFDMVVNCLWEGRDRIDRSIGIKLESGLNYRYKVGIKFPFMDEYASLPSLTIVNGAFGDFVRYTRDTGMYFSYYPVARLGITNNETKAMEWDGIAEGINPKEFTAYQVEEHQTVASCPSFPIPSCALTWVVDTSLAMAKQIFSTRILSYTNDQTFRFSSTMDILQFLLKN